MNNLERGVVYVVSFIAILVVIGSGTSYEDRKDNEAYLDAANNRYEPEESPLVPLDTRYNQRGDTVAIGEEKYQSVEIF